MKQCSKCRESKELSDYFNNAKSNDGKHTQCKQCMTEYRRQWYQKTKDQRNAVERRYYKSPSGRAIKLKSRYKQIEKFPEKETARRMVLYALRNGKLIRQPCEECGETLADAHHDDYMKPLDVRWLCEQHHKDFHRLQNKLK